MSLTEKERLFVSHYLELLNASQAARLAGYSERSAGQLGWQMLRKPHIAQAIDEAIAERIERVNIRHDDVIRRWWTLANADPNELASVIVGSCRYCHGEDNKYQWIDEAEFDRAQTAYFDLPDEQRGKRPAPTIAGGFGYKWRNAPNEHCMHCDGFGHSRTVIRDTTELSEPGQLLFAGVKETPHGIEIKMHDRMEAMTNVARHLGMFPSKVELSGPQGKPIETINTEMTAAEAAAAYAATIDSDEG